MDIEEKIVEEKKLLFDLILLGIFIYQIIFGWKQGFITMIFRFVIAIVSMIFAFYIAKIVSELYAAAIATIFTFIISLFLIRNLLFYIVNTVSNIFNRVPLIGKVNRLFGSVLGIFIALSLSYILILIFKVISPFSSGIENLLRESYILKVFN